MFHIHYREWGPDRNNPESPYSRHALRARLARRAIVGERPDDN